MKHADLVDLIDYNYWARDRMLEVTAGLTPEQFTRQVASSFGSVRDTLVHSYSAEWVWYSRWNGVSPEIPLSTDGFPDLASLVDAWRELEQQVRAFVGRLDDDEVDRQIDYRMMNGTAARSSFQQMIQHVVNHGTYHRGQVTTLLRQLGVTSLRSTDMSTYFRERGSGPR